MGQCVLELDQLPARAWRKKDTRQDCSECTIISQAPVVSVEERVAIRNFLNELVRGLSE